MSWDRLHPDDLRELARLVAERVTAELSDALDHRAAPAQLLDAAQIARIVGMSRDGVYRRADEFGAVRIGSGPRPRLRFDPAKVAAALATCPATRESQPPNRPPRQGSGRWRTSDTDLAFPLLPVRGL